MPSCCVSQCGARKSKNQPTLTFHRLPANENSKRKWLEIIGINNINPRHKTKFVCSLHFDKTAFNRTLDVVRLHDAAVPSSSLLISDETSKPVLQERQDVPKATASVNAKLPNAVSEQIMQKQNRKISHLTIKCDNLKKRVKMLTEKVRRRDQKIAFFSNIIKDLQKRNLLKVKK